MVILNFDNTYPFLTIQLFIYYVTVRIKPEIGRSSPNQILKKKLPHKHEPRPVKLFISYISTTQVHIYFVISLYYMLSSQKIKAIYEPLYDLIQSDHKEVSMIMKYHNRRSTHGTTRKRHPLTARTQLMRNEQLALSQQDDCWRGYEEPHHKRGHNTNIHACNGSFNKQ